MFFLNHQDLSGDRDRKYDGIGINIARKVMRVFLLREISAAGANGWVIVHKGIHLFHKISIYFDFLYARS